MPIFHQSHTMKHLPNTLTIGRIILTPVFVYLMLKGSFVSQVCGVVIFILAALSDLFDGKIARKHGYTSRLGKFLDPLADKVLVLSALCIMPILLPGVVPWWAVGLIAARDILITAKRMWAESQGKSIPTLHLAKWKTTVQLTFVISVLVFIAATKTPVLPELGRLADWLLYSPFTFVFLLITVAFTLYTGILYFQKEAAAS